MGLGGSQRGRGTDKASIRGFGDPDGECYQQMRPPGKGGGGQSQAGRGLGCWVGMESRETERLRELQSEQDKATKWSAGQ